MYQSSRYQYEGSRVEFLEFVLQFDDPAFLRRARGVDLAWQDLLRRCRSRRKVMLETASIRLATLGGLVRHDWIRLTPNLVKESDAAYLASLFTEWQPQLRSRVLPSKSPRRIRRGLNELVDSLDAFNQSWQRFVLDLDLNAVNHVREDYNNYYVLEKACAFASEHIGQAGFEALELVTADHVLAEFPILAVPKLS